MSVWQYDNPTRYFVASGSDPAGEPPWLVELEASEEFPDGECQCWPFMHAGKYVGPQTCKHIKRARLHLMLRIARGDFDRALTNQPNA